MRADLRDKPWKVFYMNIVAGTGWVVGVTVGFTVLVSALSFILSILGGLPVIGEFVASLVEVTKNAMIDRGY